MKRSRVGYKEAYRRKVRDPLFDCVWRVTSRVAVHTPSGALRVVRLSNYAGTVVHVSESYLARHFRKVDR